MSSNAMKFKIAVKEESPGIENEIKIDVAFEDKDDIPFSDTDFQDLYVEDGHKEYSDTFKGKITSESQGHLLIEEEKNIKEHGREAFSCLNCKFVFESEDDLVSHLESFCKGKATCSRYSSDSRELDLKTRLFNPKNAVFKSNEKGKLFKCSECSYECNQKRYLKEHVLKHRNIKLFKCSECNYECNHKGSFNRHLLTHGNTKLFKCSECNYECNRKGDLKSHLLTHAKSKLFKCSECNYESNRKSHFKRHLLTHGRDL